MTARLIKLMTPETPVGAELAREGVNTVNAYFDWIDAFASKLCSYGFCGV
jgi:hypothetical protein